MISAPFFGGGHGKHFSLRGASRTDELSFRIVNLAARRNETTPLDPSPSFPSFPSLSVVDVYGPIKMSRCLPLVHRDELIISLDSRGDLAQRSIPSIETRVPVTWGLLLMSRARDEIKMGNLIGIDIDGLRGVELPV